MTPSSKAPVSPPTGRAPNDGSGGPSFRLLASQKQEQGRALPFTIAALAHAIIIVLVIVFAPASVRLLTSVFDVEPLLLVDDNPPPIAAPDPSEAARQATRQPDEDERTRTPPPRVSPSRAQEAPVTPLIAPTEIPRTIPQPAAGAGAADDRSAADRFSSGTSHPLLFAPPAGQPPAAVGPEAATARIADRVKQINDSIMAERLAAERARDWTFVDEDGKRWGISPGKIHLGDVTIPLQYSSNNTFSDILRPPPGRREEFNAIMRSWQEIEQQASRGVVTGNMKERIKAIRERKDKERAAKKRPIT